MAEAITAYSLKYQTGGFRSAVIEQRNDLELIEVEDIPVS